MNRTRIAHIFIDEYGTPSLEIEKDGVSPFFIYAAVIIPESELLNARELLARITKEYFPQQGYIKSSNIHNNTAGYSKYINILTEINSLRHFVHVLVVDKENVKRDSGLSIKQSFIKYFQRLLSRSFFEQYEEFHIVADETGYPEFIQSLETYMRDKAGIEPTLFTTNTFSMENDTTGEPLIQLADLYAGIIGRYYCGKFDENRATVIHNIIRSRISIEWFPEESVSIIAANDSLSQTFDIELFRLSIDTAVAYIDRNPGDRIGCELLSYLIQETKRNPWRHISSKEIKSRLTSIGLEIGDPINKVSDLRDNGVIIISPIGKKGYKFPTSEKEIAEFLNRLSGNVIPQIRRGYIINRMLAEKSFGKYNVLNSPDFSVLNMLSNIVNKQQ